MAIRRPKILFVTDLYYQTYPRDYAAEDVYLTSVLRESFDLVICHPKDTEPFEQVVDGIVVRNSGPVIFYQDEYDAFWRRLMASNQVVYNSLDGKADMRGKQYLVDLSAQGYPVIPTVDRHEELARLPECEDYVVKPKMGADSVGMRTIPKEELPGFDLGGFLLQPRIEMLYEVSFVFVDHDLHYALYSPDPEQRWKLEPYTWNAADQAFAERFISWNDIQHGVQRVDACRTRDGDLLLVELEDLNPFLSLLDLEADVRQRWLDSFQHSLRNALAR